MPDKYGEKFLFNVHCFDDVPVKEAEEEPPPPTYTEAELENAKKDSFTAGYEKALQESKDSRAQQLKSIMEKISEDVGILFTQESQRAQLYEQEAVKLARAIFTKVFPLYQENFGFDELKNSIKTVLERHQEQKDITIYVNPDLTQGVQACVGKLSEKNTAFKLTVIEDESLNSGACKLSWADGGAVRNSEAMAEQIHALIKQALAGKETKVHDKKSDDV